MSDYKPSAIVAKLAEKLHGKPIAESLRIDGMVVIVFEDSRKKIFDKDAITRTLTEPDIATPETAMSQGGVMPPLTTSASRDAEDKPHKRSKKGTNAE